MRSAAVITLLLGGLVLASGCRTPAPKDRGPYALTAAENRDTVLAQALSREGAELVATDPDRAEEILRSALAADLFYGPAHNNLGVVFLGRGDLYDAANEFEWAKKLMPGHPDPRVNLALVLEQAGKVEESWSAYDSALEAYPDHVPAIQGLARAAVRDGRHDSRLVGWLEVIALDGEGDGWRSWARGQLAELR